MASIANQGATGHEAVSASHGDSRHLARSQLAAFNYLYGSLANGGVAFLISPPRFHGWVPMRWLIAKEALRELFQSPSATR